MFVCNMFGGVVDVVNYFMIWCGKNIMLELFCFCLCGVGDSCLLMEMFELLIEWMQEKVESEVYVFDVLYVLNVCFGLVVEYVDDYVVDDVGEFGMLCFVLMVLYLQVYVGFVVDDVMCVLVDQWIDD